MEEINVSETISQRVLKFITAQGMSASTFADTIGVQRSAISHLNKGRNEPSLPFLKKIKEAYPKVNLEWLVMGEGPMYNGPQVDSSAVDTAPIVTESATEAVDGFTMEDSDPETETEDPAVAIEEETQIEPPTPAKSIRKETAKKEPVKMEPVATATVASSPAAPNPMFSPSGDILLFDPITKTYTIYKLAQ